MSHRKIILTVHDEDIRNLTLQQTHLILSRHLELYKKTTAEISEQVSTGDKESAWASYVQLINVLVNTSRELTQVKTLVDEIPQEDKELSGPSFPGENNQKD